jgi:hypothetical protein
MNANPARFRAIFVASLCALLLTACGSKPYVDYDTGYDFTAAQSYYIIPTATTDEPLMGPRIAAAIHDELTARGLTASASRSAADIAITYSISAQEKPNKSRISIGLGTGGYGSRGGTSVGGSVSKPIGSDMLLYNSIQIDMFPGDADNLIWRSSDAFEVKGVDAQQKAEAAQRLVKRILAPFPP